MEEFFCPDDFEISHEELTSVCAKAHGWRGLTGSTRKVILSTYVEEDRTDPHFREITKVTNYHLLPPLILIPPTLHYPTTIANAPPPILHPSTPVEVSLSLIFIYPDPLSLSIVSSTRLTKTVKKPYSVTSCCYPTAPSSKCLNSSKSPSHHSTIKCNESSPIRTLTPLSLACWRGWWQADSLQMIWCAYILIPPIDNKSCSSRSSC